MGWMDSVAFILNVWCVGFIVLEWDSNWPIGVAGSVALAYVLWKGELYAQFWLQVFYAMEGFYGWWMWTRRDKVSRRKLIRIGKTKWQTAIWMTVISVVGMAVCYPLFLWTNDPFPFWDCVVMVVSLVAEYMLCVKLLEAWGVYLATDVISVVILAKLQMWVTLGTYGVFMVLCVLGILAWRRSLKNSGSGLSLGSSIP